MAGGSFELDPTTVRSITSSMVGLTSHTASVAGDLASAVINGASFASIGSAVASANATLQSQLTNGLNSTLTLLNGIENDISTAVAGYVSADEDVAAAFGGGTDKDVAGLALINADGELNGGINPALPTDVPTLEKMLADARDSGKDPSEYAALLQQHWLAKAADHAGIDLNSWDPSTGIDGNAQNVRNVYNYYGNLYLNHPELQWTGMANMIGPSFAAGFYDLNSMKDVANGLNDKIQSLPGPVQDMLPPEVRDLGQLGKAGGDELNWYQDKFLAMQKHIFIDQGSMHEAYLNGGLPAIDEMRSAGLIDDNAQNAWHQIASGDPAQVQAGNTALLSREQNQIIDQQYNEMRQHDGPVGAAVTYGMTAAGAASIPGTLTPGQYSPLTVGGDVTFHGVISDETVGVHLKTPLPDFNITDKDARWDYITHDTLPAYQNLIQNNPDLARQIINTPLDQRINEQLMSNRMPQLTHDMLTNWHLSADGHVDFHWPQWPF